MYNNSIPNNQVIYSNYRDNGNRGPFLPFIVGGVAGTALGYGIANNNFLANQPRPMPMPMPCCSGPMFYPQQQPYFWN